jgi:hypothetical protein
MMTSNSDATLERIARRVPVPQPAYERVLRRRNRKRRNQRIAAGVVGIVVFVAAVWIVTTGFPSDRTRTDVVPAGSGARSGETGPPVVVPTDTVPADTGPAVIPTVTGPTGMGRPEADFLGFSLPPQGTPPSTPANGELLLEDGGIHPWWAVQVYADGRVIWLREVTVGYGWLERRLNPEGIELVRSGGVDVSRLPASVPASGWEDPEARSYVPSRYVVCDEWSQQTMRLLPQRTQELLRGHTDEQAVVRGEIDYSAGGAGVACTAVTIEEARALDKSFLEAGFKRIETAGGLVYDIPDVNSIGVIPLLPDGTFRECCPG